MFRLSHRPVTGPQQRGFTLLEVLIAVIVLALGLLGLAKLQTAGLTVSNVAYLRTQGTILAYEAVDMVRADRESAHQIGCYDMDVKDQMAAGCGNADKKKMIQDSTENWKERLRAMKAEGSLDVEMKTVDDMEQYMVTVRIWLLDYNDDDGTWVEPDSEKDPLIELVSGI